MVEHIDGTLYSSEYMEKDIPFITNDFLFLNSPVAMAIISANGNILKCNQIFSKLLRFNNMNEVQHFNYFHNEQRDISNYYKIASLLSTKSDFVHEEIWHLQPHLIIYLKESLKIVQSGKGHSFYFVTLEDVTEFKKASRNFSIAEEKFNVIFDHIPVGIYRMVATGELLFVNKRLAEILGYEHPNELNGRQALSFCKMQPEDMQYIIKQIRNHASSYFVEYKIIKKDGSTVWVRDSANITYDTSNQIIFIDGAIEDITIRKNTENELDQLITAINQISEVIVVTDIDGSVIYANPAFEKLTQYSLSEVTGKKMNILKSGVQGAEFYKKIWKTILSGKNWSGNLINKKKNGETYEEHCVITPVRSTQGAIVSFVAIKRDITEEKKLEIHLRNSQKLQAVGTLAGGIAHDFNNILMGMQVFTEILIKKTSKEAPELQLLEKIYTSQNRAKSLIKQILSFSRLSGDEREMLDVHIVVKEALKLISATLPASIKVKQKINDCGCILANPAQIQQIVMNLCTNANHSMEGEGVLTIELKKMNHIELPDGRIGKSDKPWICLIVKDSGCGIEDKIKERIFEPFFTTKAVGAGTGLGLSTVHGIVKQYGGEIHFTTKLGTGTNFYIYLPAL